MKNINNAAADVKTANRFNDCNTFEEVVAKTLTLVDRVERENCEYHKEQFDKRNSIKERIDNLHAEDASNDVIDAAYEELNELPTDEDLDEWYKSATFSEYEKIVEDGIARYKELGGDEEEYLTKINYY